MHALGIDVSKQKLDTVLISESETHKPVEFKNNQRGHRALVHWLQEQQIPVHEIHICLEATGRYGEQLADFLHEQGYRVSVVNPAQIHAYRQCKMVRNKNDRIDAYLIADFCLNQHPPLWLPATQHQREMKEISRHINTLKQDRQRKRNQRKAGIISDTLQRSLDENIRFLDEQIQQLQTALEELICTDETSAHQLELLLSIPNIGMVTACAFLSEIVDVSRFAQASHLAAYAGLVPREHSSGTSVNKKPRLAKTGNAHLRTIFYMPALSAHRHNPVICNLRDRLLARGKTPMTVVAAVMRKLLHLAYGVLKTGKPFDPNHMHSIPVGG